MRLSHQYLNNRSVLREGLEKLLAHMGRPGAEFTIYEDIDRDALIASTKTAMRFSERREVAKLIDGYGTLDKRVFIEAPLLRSPMGKRMRLHLMHGKGA